MAQNLLKVNIFNVGICFPVKINQMKLLKITGTGIAAILAICSLAIAPRLMAEDAPIGKGGAQLLMQARPVKSADDGMKTKDGDIAVSTCPMCKTTSYKRIDSAKGGAGQLGQTGKGSSCPACGAMIDNDSKVMKHACKKCGAEMICVVIPAEDHHGIHAQKSNKDNDNKDKEDDDDKDDKK